jgi:transcription-repair coupling factor (superfamily II helicase)
MAPVADLAKTLRTIGGYEALRDAARDGRALTVRGPIASGAALLVAALVDELDRTTLVLCPGVEYAEEFAEDVNLVREGLACHFPPMEALPDDREEPNEAIVKARLSVLRHLVFGTGGSAEAGLLEPRAGTRAVAVSINALLQPTCAAEDLRENVRHVAVGDAATPQGLVTWLVESGFLSAPRVELPGHYSLRGGILDVFSHGTDRPVRIEFFGDEVDSIRSFDRATQLSYERVRTCQFVASRDPLADPTVGAENLLGYLSPDDLIVMVEPQAAWARAEELVATDVAEFLVRPEELQASLARRGPIAFVADGDEEAVQGGEIAIPCRRRDAFGIDLDGTLEELARVCTDCSHTRIFCMGPAEEERLRALLRDHEFGPIGRLAFGRGRLNHAALFSADGIALIPHHRLLGRYRQRRVLRHAEEARPIEAAAELRPGDIVVHVQHGIGRFRGTRVLDAEGRRQEHLEIEFADDVRVYVPSDRIEMVHRYIGAGGARPVLSRLHGAQWRTARRKAERAVEDMAAELLRMQALRRTRPGIAAPPDDEWQHQFESEFPYEETEDQLRAIAELKVDMTAPRPMDRLICGDVGYGKTEIAMRATFKAVLGGRQVAMLVPTTVLAQQHHRTFRERMADYPVRVEMLSRFVSPAQTRDVLTAMAEGKVDVVIGTHRLVQKDVVFKDLGLVIVDEEQRFGVKDKERFKTMRTTVDVLTLTATPIPRTLHMSLMGLRDISSLQTPPQDRLAIETHVTRFDPGLLRHAVIRELSREGQVFLVHNRVRSIQGVAATVRELVPEARVAVAHGQMPERELADAMERFVDGSVDVLVSTTIVRNGLDIPNANTLIINRADILGLSEMHQLRGRVGRYIHKAYAYFFTPNDRPVTPEAQVRLDAIKRYSGLGAGFEIALRDLEIRGAGNILGSEQSGHIAAIGYSLYCRLLARATASLKGQEVKEPPSVTINIGLDAYLPDGYVPALEQRMEVYRQIGRAADLEGVRIVERGMKDRFGPLPEEAQNLLLEAEVRILAAEAGIDSLQMQDGRLHFHLRDADRFSRYFERAKVKPRVVDEELAVLDARLSTGGRQAAQLARDLLANA